MWHMYRVSKKLRWTLNPQNDAVIKTPHRYIFSTTTKISLVIIFLFVSSPPFVIGNTTLKSVGECSDVIQNAVGECLAFVTLVSEVDEPEAMCCLGFKEVMDTGCLCRWFNDMGSLGFTFNVTKAYSLPYACKLVDPSMASCGLSILSPPAPPTYPYTSPSPSPSPSPSHPSPSPTPTSASAPAPVPSAGSRRGKGSAPVPTPSQRNHVSSLKPISTLSFVTTGALVMLCFI